MRNLMKVILERLLAWAARRVIATEQPTIVGVTGSSGKTSTKEAIAVVLRAAQSLPVVAAGGNLNSEFGLPLAVLEIAKPETVLDWVRTAGAALRLGLVPPHRSRRIMVLEFGAEFPGDIAKLIAIAQPSVAVITNIGPAHLEFFRTLDNVAREKATLIRNVPATGRVILSADDQFADWMATQTRAEVVRVPGAGGDFARATAVAVASWFDVPPAIAEQAAKQWTPPPGRLVELVGLHGSVLIDDTYNANPSSVTLALNTARNRAKQVGATRLITVLGDMLELGDETERYHRGIALLAQKAADLTVLVGRRFQGKPADHWFADPKSAAVFLKATAQSGDMILVKGSQSMRMEIIVEALLGDPADAARLVRQSPAWKAKPFIQP